VTRLAYTRCGRAQTRVAQLGLAQLSRSQLNEIAPGGVGGCPASRTVVLARLRLDPAPAPGAPPKAGPADPPLHDKSHPINADAGKIAFHRTEVTGRHQAGLVVARR
jgi:hypothetical protein